MPRKKILYLITKATRGGAQKYVFDLATNLPKSEFESLVMYGTEGALVHELTTAGIKTRHLPSLGRDIAIFSDIRSFFEIRRSIKELHADVIHLNSSKAAALGALAARFAKVPNIIFTVHGWPFKEERGALTRAFIYFISWCTACLSHTVIVVSKTDEQLAKRMWGIRKKVRYIPLGIKYIEALAPDSGFRAMFGTLQPARLQSGTLRMVTMAELTANKGLSFAIEAVALLRERGVDTIYVIAGEGEDRNKLQSLAKKIGVEDRVFFPGFVAHAARNLSGFDVFVLPSIKEGTPYVLLEAARVGIPIVTTTSVDRDLASLILNMRIVPTKDPVALADAIVELSKAPRTQPMRLAISSLQEMAQKTGEYY